MIPAHASKKPPANTAISILQLQEDVEKLTNSAKLSDTLQDVDQIINLLTEAREKVAAGKLNKQEHQINQRIVRCICY